MLKESQDICYNCKKQIDKNKKVLCSECSKDPFKVEDLRTSLAEIDKQKLFKLTYSTNYIEINNMNTRKFWDSKFAYESTIKDQDSMTKDKINQIVQFLPEGGNLLDLGFGQAYLEERIRQLGRDQQYKIFGIDISSTAVKRAQKKFNGVFLQGDVFEINKKFRESYFDSVIAIELIEHISPSKIFELYAKIHKLLKKNSIFIISTPLNEGLKYKRNNPSGHVREYTIPILLKEFDLAGFKVVDYKTFVAFEKNYYTKSLINKIYTFRKPNNIVIKAIKK